jgi:alpha-amylase/alpha-mannosidase (GH57 family)
MTTRSPRYVCVHGHFYQPPRENPWLEAIEEQPSAFPYHDWNERITDECYRRNAHARVLDEQGWIERIVNNYARISFDFGPTLLSWLAEHASDVYLALLEADRESRRRFGGHGSALAQAHGHTILPLGSARDLRTQVIWGLRDFEHRFGRSAEGMWLPETAADTATLEALAERGVRFTVLAPRQAARVRPLGAPDAAWETLADASIDPSRAYAVRLPSGRSLAVFFYDGPISQAVAFERLLDSGPALVDRLIGGFDERRDWPQLVHIATDGESYGHHHRHGEMALAAALDAIEARDDVDLINYAAFLELHPPTHQVEIVQRSSWSCAHGVGRWSSDCTCCSGAHPGWNQSWRGPLRDALDWLRDQAAPRFEQAAGELLRDPWGARDVYVEVVLDRGVERRERFLAEHALRPLERQEQTRVLELLELQRHAMLMYTSCGWFFDDVSGIESVQVLRYAARVMQLARDLFGEDLEPGFRERLRPARSNVEERGSAADIYDRMARSAVVDLVGVGAHYAVSSVFEAYAERSTIYCYEVELEDSHRLEAGRARLHVGLARMVSRITLRQARVSFAVMHLGDLVLSAAVRPFESDQGYQELVRSARARFRRGDFTDLMRLIDRVAGDSSYSLASLFRDQQRRVIDRVLLATLGRLENTYERLYDSHAPLLRYLGSLAIPAPGAVLLPAQFVVNARLARALATDPLDVAAMRRHLEEAREQALVLDHATLRLAAERAIERLARAVADRPRHSELIELAIGALEILQQLPFDLDLGELQNAVYEHVRPWWAPTMEEAARGDGQARRWIESVGRLRDVVRVRMA